MPVKGSRASAPEVTPNSLTGTLHRGLAVRSHLQAVTLNFSAALHFIADIYRKMYHFLPWREIFILVVWAATKAYNRRWCSSRQAIISHPQDYSPNGGRCHLAGLCWGFSQHTALLCVSLGRAEPHGWLQQVYDYFSSKGESHRSTISCKQGELVNIKSVVSVVKFDYLQLHL